ncbi:MAG: hypothetical protein ABIG68_01150 [Acidobacteriota bacterium]
MATVFCGEWDIEPDESLAAFVAGADAQCAREAMREVRGPALPHNVADTRILNRLFFQVGKLREVVKRVEGGE